MKTAAKKIIQDVGCRQMCLTFPGVEYFHRTVHGFQRKHFAPAFLPLPLNASFSQATNTNIQNMPLLFYTFLLFIQKMPVSGQFLFLHMNDLPSMQRFGCEQTNAPADSRS